MNACKSLTSKVQKSCFVLPLKTALQSNVIDHDFEPLLETDFGDTTAKRSPIPWKLGRSKVQLQRRSRHLHFQPLEPDVPFPAHYSFSSSPRPQQVDPPIFDLCSEQEGHISLKFLPLPYSCQSPRDLFPRPYKLASLEL